MMVLRYLRFALEQSRRACEYVPSSFHVSDHLGEFSFHSSSELRILFTLQYNIFILEYLQVCLYKLYLLAYSFINLVLQRTDDVFEALIARLSMAVESLSGAEPSCNDPFATLIAARPCSQR